MTQGKDGTGLVVVPATAADLEFIVEANRAMAEETEGRQLDVATLRAGVGAALGDRHKGHYLVARQGGEGGEAVGTLLLTTEWSDWRNGTFWWIQSVYVVPAARGRGVFRALYATVMEAARADAGICGVRLYVDHENEAARATYRGVGMKDAGYTVFEVDFSVVARSL